MEQHELNRSRVYYEKEEPKMIQHKEKKEETESDDG
jgi:hypothetical protein